MSLIIWPSALITNWARGWHIFYLPSHMYRDGLKQKSTVDELHPNMMDVVPLPHLWQVRVVCLLVVVTADCGFTTRLDTRFV